MQLQQCSFWYLDILHNATENVLRSVSVPHLQIGLVDVPVLWLSYSSFSMVSWRNNLTYEIPYFAIIWTQNVSLNVEQMESVRVLCCRLIIPESLPRFECGYCWQLFGAIISLLNGCCATSFALLSTMSLPSSPECQGMLTSYMLTERTDSWWWSDARFLILLGRMSVQSPVTDWIADIESQNCFCAVR